MKFYLLLLIPIFIATDCSNKKSIKAQSFEGEFTVQKVANIDLNQQDANFQIDLKNETISGHTGCNQFSMKYQLSGNNITFQEPVSTKMFCGNLEVNEKMLFDCFKKSNTYVLKDNILSFYNNSQELLITAHLIK